MAPQSIFISALTPSLGKSATMQLRATRIWEAFQRQPKKLLHTKVVFVDEEGSQILLTIWNNQKDDYFPLLKEGCVHNVSDVRVVGNSKDYRSVNKDLALNFYHRTKVVPTADIARIPQYAFDLTKYEDVPPLLWSTKNFITTDIILSSGDATKTYFNIDYNPIRELKDAILANTADKGNVTLQPTKKHFVTMEENTLAEVTVQEILDTQISNAKEVRRFLCEATIVDVSKYDGWYYDACQKCPKKIRIDNGKFYCDNCEVETHGYKLRYRITVGVKDDSGKATFTLINNEVERLIGVPIETIVSDISQENLTDSIPALISNVVGKKCSFEVKVTSYNQDGRGSYTVARLSQIDTCTASAAGSTANKEAGPSKKIKLT